MARRDLKIYTTVDSRGAVRSVGRMSSSMGGLAKSAAMAGAALGAAGLAAGAKKAFDEFREAEKVTNQTNAALKSTGGAAKVTAKEISGLANAISLKSGIDDEAIQSGENLLLTFTKIRDETGKGNQIFSRATQTITDMSVALDQDLKSSAIQVGKALNDPVKGMTALQRVGVSFTQDQKDRVAGWVEEGKTLKAQRFILNELTTEFGGSAAAQADASDKLKVAWENMFEAIGTAIGPTIQRVASAMAKFINQMQSGRGAGGRFADKMKDLGEALKDIGGVIGPTLKAIGQFVLDHPKVAAMAVAVGALAGGLAKLRGGGPGKLGTIGQAIGAMKPVPVFVTNAGLGGKGGPVPVPGGGKAGGRVPGVAKLLWPVAATLAADEALGNPKAGNTNRGLAVVAGKTPGLGANRREVVEWAKHVKANVGEVNEVYKGHVAASRQAFHAAGERLKDLREKTAAETGRIKERFGTDTAKGRDALKDHYREAAEAAKRQMDRAGVVTSRGLDFIRDMFVKELKLYGINAGEARHAVKQGGTRDDTFRLLGHQTGGKLAMGGMPVPGFGQGDKVHMQAMVEPGEQVFVLNRNASAALRQLEGLNAQIPRFQGGGGLRPGISNLVSNVLRNFPGLSVTSTTGGGHAPGSYHYRGMAADMASGNYTYMNQAAAWIRRRYGRSLTEGIHNPNLSVKYGKPVSPGYWGGSTWAGHANHIHLAVAGALEAMGIRAPKLGRVNVGGRGPLRNIVQKGLNITRSGAQRRLNRLSASSPDTGFRGTAGGQYGKRQLANLWTRAGGDPQISNLMAAIALAESGGNPRAHNPSGASGLWQILGQIVPGNVFNPLVNARNAVAKYRSQGLGAWVAYTNGNYRQFLKRGGLVRRQRGGLARRQWGGGLPRFGRPNLRHPGPGGRTWGRRRPHAGRSPFQWGQRNMWGNNAPVGNIPKPDWTQMDVLDAWFAQAQLTETLADDISVGEAAEAEALRRYNRAVRSGDPRRVTEAAGVLKGWRDTLTGLRESAGGGADISLADLAQAVKELKDSIDEQNRITSSTAAIGLREAQRALADMISGQIGGQVGQRGRSAGDGITAARY